MSMPTLPGPEDIIRRELPNGITVLVRENFNANSVVINGSVDAGSLFDPENTEGLAAFTAASLIRGTLNRDFATIHEMLEGNGASLSASSGIHTAGFSGKSLAEDLPMLLDLLADVLRNPAFPERQVERLRGEFVTGLKIREQDTRYRAGRAVRELAYPAEHPYSRAADGTIDSISHIRRQELIDFHRQHFGPQRMLIAIVGAVETEEAIQLVDRCFGDWENHTQPATPILVDIPVLDSIRTETVILPGKSQADLILGLPGPSRFVDDWEAAHLANHVLGVFGMFGRIGREVREKRGMAYYSFSRLDGGMGPGAWRVAAGVNPANVDRTVETILSEIMRITQELVSPEELADSQANITGRLPLQLETNEGVAGSILTMERYKLGLDYLQRYAERINAITAEDVLAAAQRYLRPDGYALAIAGPEVAQNGNEMA